MKPSAREASSSGVGIFRATGAGAPEAGHQFVEEMLTQIGLLAQDVEQYLFRGPFAPLCFLGLKRVPQMRQGTSSNVRALFEHIREQNKYNLARAFFFLVKVFLQYWHINLCSM